jgi:hypothetical protein
MTETANSPAPLPKAVATVTSELSSLQSDLGENVLAQALPVPDLVFGGTVLVLVIMFHAFWIRSITGVVLRRFIVFRSRPALGTLTWYSP